MAGVGDDLRPKARLEGRLVRRPLQIAAPRPAAKEPDRCLMDRRYKTGEALWVADSSPVWPDKDRTRPPSDGPRLFEQVGLFLDDARVERLNWN